MSLTPERESIIHSIIGKARQDIPHPHPMVHRQSAVVKSLLQHVGEDGDGGALINERVKQILRGILIDNAKFLVSLSLSLCKYHHLLGTLIPLLLDTGNETKSIGQE